MKHPRQSKCGVINVIVDMLSLILKVIIVGNVVLWSYHMNQLDREKCKKESLSQTWNTRLVRPSSQVRLDILQRSETV